MIRTMQTEQAFVCARPSQVGANAPSRRDHPLDGLRGSGLADRFCAWAGQSGRRFIFSVFPLRYDGCADDLPLLPGAVVLAVRRDRGGPRRVLWATILTDEAGRAGLAREAERMAHEAGAEFHLHLLATDQGEREVILADLDFPPVAGADEDRTAKGRAVM